MKKETPPPVTQVHLVGIALSETSRTENDTLCALTSVRGLNTPH